MSERSLRVLPLALAPMDEADLLFHIFAGSLFELWAYTFPSFAPIANK
ncbi:hypothetical protein J2Z48_000926 [Croceifilum oryzae]|uniref:Uncharacterized protein n=1 Tax=Croceifilum oryzae TaxID=1553429 RepID=A0AAJ1TE06_9BACL|nr:hypothetical protein [Croceifilum oryzae]MDQ0416759.1 hypothetical protein [Croceifilum oryzae]